MNLERGQLIKKRFPCKIKGWCLWKDLHCNNCYFFDI